LLGRQCDGRPYAAGMNVAERLRAVAGELLDDFPVEFAYLFGSHARGQAHADSDVDVAVHLSRDVDDGRYLSLSLDIAGQLAYRSGVGPIDGVVVLNDAPLRLVGRVLRDAQVIYCRDEVARVRYEVEMRARAFDFELHAAELDRLLLARMAERH
jgi:uncharacterized protein